MTAPFQYGVVVLAAGASSRMGSPKLLLPWGSSTVVDHLVRQWKELGANQVAVVHAKEDHLLLAELDRMNHRERVENPTPELEMFSSIQCASRWPEWRQSTSHVIIALGDQPHLSKSTLSTLLEFSRKHPQSICQPSVGSRGKHPIVFPADEFRLLRDSSHPTLRHHLESMTTATSKCEINDPLLSLDLDRPADYEEALRQTN